MVLYLQCIGALPVTGWRESWGLDESSVGEQLTCACGPCGPCGPCVNLRELVEEISYFVFLHEQYDGGSCYECIHVQYNSRLTCRLAR